MIGCTSLGRLGGLLEGDRTDQPLGGRPAGVLQVALVAAEEARRDCERRRHLDDILLSVECALGIGRSSSCTCGRLIGPSSFGTQTSTFRRHIRGASFSFSTSTFMAGYCSLWLTATPLASLSVSKWPTSCLCSNIPMHAGSRARHTGGLDSSRAP